MATRKLHAACRWGIEAFVRSAIDEGASVNSFDKRHRSPLVLGMESVDLSLVVLIMQLALVVILALSRYSWKRELFQTSAKTRRSPHSSLAASRASPPSLSAYLVQCPK